MKGKALRCSKSTGCEENMRLAQRWVSECLGAHPGCSVIDGRATLPTRILDLEPSSSSDDVRLVMTNGATGQYLTLSHVWGQTQLIRTTLSTLSQHLESIPLNNLPPTFKDAVAVGRSLGIRNLWIDSLCIIQDSREDWVAESGKMGEYYRNSLFTIAAVSATDSKVGCFMDRNSLSTTPSFIKFHLPREYQRDEPVSCFLRPAIGWDPADETVNFQRPPLWQRAWVLQERLLSCRILCFSDVQMSWKCLSGEASERVPEGTGVRVNMSESETLIRDMLSGKATYNISHISQSQLFTTPDRLPTTTGQLLKFYNAWYDLLMLYGRCGLTKAGDILPAMSGIAKLASIATGDQYLAGLWRHDIHRGLLWTAPDSTSSRTDLRVYRAPTWSWASLPASSSFYVRQVLLADIVRTDMFEIQQASVVASSINPFGEVSGGRLIVKTRLKLAQPGGLPAEEEAFQGLGTDRSEPTLFDLNAGHSVGYFFADNIDRRYLSEVWCCPVLVEERASLYATEGEEANHQPLQAEARCLVLFPIGVSERVYMRVGLAWILDYEWFEDTESTVISII